MTVWTRDFIVGALSARSPRAGGDLPAGFPTVSTDSRNVAGGQLFVALEGERLDAHAFVKDALAAGAGAAVVARVPEGVDEGRLLVVDDTLRALQDLAAALLDHHRPRRGALTGSNGKTSTKELLAAALRAHYGEDAVLATLGNLNNHVGVPLTAFRLEAGHQVAVFEMGMNHLREIERLCEIVRPEVGLITNIGTAHAGNVGGIEGVARAKGELFAGLAEGGTAVVNLDDERVVGQLRRAPAGTRPFTFGARQGDVQLIDQRATAEGMAVTLTHDGRSITVELPLVGAHNAVNATGAVAAAVALGVPFDVAVPGLARVVGVPGRLRVRAVAQGPLVLDDTYNANPDSTRAALDTLLARCEGRRPVAALGNMLELGDEAPAAHAEIGAYAVKVGVLRLFACGDLGRHYLEGARKAGLPEDAATWAEDSEALAPLVAGELGSGDAVLVKGSRGARMERVVEKLVGGEG